MRMPSHFSGIFVRFKEYGILLIPQERKVPYGLKNKKRWNNGHNLGLAQDPDSSKSMDPNRDTMNCDPGSHCSYEQCYETVMI
jgi:hypothetical protein